MKKSLHDDQNFYNFLFAVLFASLLFLMAAHVYDEYGYVPYRVPIFHAILISLAIFRLIRLFSYDKITHFARDWFLDKRKIVENGEEVIILEAPKRGIRRTITELLGCPWCTGVWISLFVVYFYFTVPGFFFVILVLAIAGVASFLQLIANLIGWSAELRKIETEEKAGE